MRGKLIQRRKEKMQTQEWKRIKASRELFSAPEAGRIIFGVDPIFGELMDNHCERQMKNIGTQIQKDLWTQLKFLNEEIHIEIQIGTLYGGGKEREKTGSCWSKKRQPSKKHMTCANSQQKEWKWETMGESDGQAGSSPHSVLSKVPWKSGGKLSSDKGEMREFSSGRSTPTGVTAVFSSSRRKTVWDSIVEV